MGHRNIEVKWAKEFSVKSAGVLESSNPTLLPKSRGSIKNRSRTSPAMLKQEQAKNIINSFTTALIAGKNFMKRSAKSLSVKE